MSKRGVWFAKRTGEDFPGEPWSVVRTFDGVSFEVRSYADSRDEADVLASEANAVELSGGVP